MDYQNRPGSKTGGGGVASESETNAHRRERLRKLALETIDLSKDPYFMKNHLGSYECKLCLTLHPNEGSYLAHTQGKKHQYNLGQRAYHEARNLTSPAAQLNRNNNGVAIRKFISIGRPGFRATKVRDPLTGRLGILFQVDYPDIAHGIIPRTRFMAGYEQHVEAPSREDLYLLFAAEPYATIAFRLQASEVDKTPGATISYWDPDTKQFTFQFFFKLVDWNQQAASLNGQAQLQ